ncbi:MAG: helix-turn-helix domain-containing protein [Saprospiraceae bacterium]
MNDREKKISIVVEKTATGFSSFAKDYPIFSTGKSIPDLKINTLEAVKYYFEDEVHPLETSELHFEVDFKQFFQYYRVLNAKFLADKIGMNPTLLSQYVKGKKKPSQSQTEKILEGIHQIGAELMELNLIYR